MGKLTEHNEARSLDALIASGTLQELLDYNPDTGVLRWRLRDIKYFNDGKRWSAKQNCDRWNKRYAGTEAGSASNSTSYLMVGILGTIYLAHRVAYALYHGVDTPRGVGHVNYIKTDNRIWNLRPVAREDSMRYREKVTS